MQYEIQEAESFRGNLSLFMDTMQTDDPEMTRICRDNLELLIRIVRGGDRDQDARAAFNSAVDTALETLLASIPEE